MRKGKSPVHSDADRDIGVHGYCFFSGRRKPITAWDETWTKQGLENSPESR